MSLVDIPLFPLHTVLFPGGPLQLRIFEPRYLAMVAECMRTGSEFGVVLITKGGETGEAASTHDVGTLARIIDWDQDSDGLLNIRAIGTRRFAVKSRRVQADQLTRAQVALLPASEPEAVPARFRRQADWVKEVLPQLPSYEGIVFEDDAGWVADRIAELLSLKPSQRQVLLEMHDPVERMSRVVSLVDA